MNINYTITGFADEIDQDLGVQIEGLSKLGIHYVEMRGVDGKGLVDHDNNKVREIKKRLDDAGIKLSSVGSPFGKIDIRDDFEPHFEHFKRGVEIAHMMDCKNIRMFSFFLPKITDAENSEKLDVKTYESEVFDRIGRFVDYAVSNDVVLLHENEKDIYGEMAPECRKLMDNFYGDHFKAVFDFANFVQAGQDTLKAYELLKDYIDYIHVKDALLKDRSVVPAGYGDGNVEAILKQLFENGYEGFLSLEPHLSEFTGFASLEKGGVSIGKDSAKPLTGFEAFSTAHKALCEILAKFSLS